MDLYIIIVNFYHFGQGPLCKEPQLNSCNILKEEDTCISTSQWGNSLLQDVIHFLHLGTWSVAEPALETISLWGQNLVPPL